jgi:hypothetical protein
MGFELAILLALLGCKPSIAVPSPVPTENTYGFSQESFATLNSLEKVDDYPIYVMHYVGGYDSPATADLPDKTTFSCSLFAALGDEEYLLYGRNFDWAYAPALLLYTDPPDGYASVSMVNLGFSDINPDNFLDLLEMTVPERAPLLDAPYIPSDGMNEYGLAIGMAAVNESVAGYDSSKPTIGSLGIIREVLDHARDIDEAAAIFSRYNIDFTGGPPVHYLIADSRGRSVLIEYVDGEMVVMPNEYAWHLATNHLLATGIRGGGSSGWRYDTIEERLAATGGILTPIEAMDLLSDVSQSFNGTQWSVVYDISTGNISVAMARNYEDVHDFQLEMVDP